MSCVLQMTAKSPSSKNATPHRQSTSAQEHSRQESADGHHGNPHNVVKALTTSFGRASMMTMPPSAFSNETQPLQSPAFSLETSSSQSSLDIGDEVPATAVESASAGHLSSLSAVADKFKRSVKKKKQNQSFDESSLLLDAVNGFGNTTRQRSARTKEVQAKMMVQFIIDKTGSTSEEEVVERYDVVFLLHIITTVINGNRMVSDLKTAKSCWKICMDFKLWRTVNSLNCEPNTVNCMVRCGGKYLFIFSQFKQDRTVKPC